MSRSRLRTTLAGALAALVALTGASAIPASAEADCTPRLLILSAFPGEIDRLLTQATISRTEPVDGRTFYVGTLEGNDVVLGLTGIGLVNAGRATRAALARFECETGSPITGIVFSGVSGGRTSIGDVAVPAKWSDDAGTTWFPTDDAMLQTAAGVIANGDVDLLSQVPVGDPACVGADPTAASTVAVDPPEFLVGGEGKSADSFGGRALPCFPGGGDVFGCAPCRAPSHAAPDPARTVGDAVPFLDPAFFFGYFASPPGTSGADADDMETGAVARVAAEEGIPFIAFRSLSDGDGDPLMLPGFPFQFFYYRQLAAENAARTTLAFLRAWGLRD